MNSKNRKLTRIGRENFFRIFSISYDQKRFSRKTYETKYAQGHHLWRLLGLEKSKVINLVQTFAIYKWKFSNAFANGKLHGFSQKNGKILVLRLDLWPNIGSEVWISAGIAKKKQFKVLFTLKEKIHQSFLSVSGQNTVLYLLILLSISSWSFNWDQNPHILQTRKNLIKF